MKRMIYKAVIAPAFAIVLFLSSCTKIDDSVYSDIVASKYTFTKDDLSGIVGSAYTPYRGQAMGWGNPQLNDWSSDQVVVGTKPWGWYDGGKWKRLFDHKLETTDEQPTWTWDNCYKAINNINRTIYQIEKGLLPLEKGKKELLAELKAVRALNYYSLCDIYGNVPYLTKFDVPQGFLPEQTNRKALYDSIVSELTTSMPLLSETVDQTTYGRFNKYAATALLARMYLNAQVYSGTPQLDKCIAACDVIINSGKFELAANQKDNFVTDNQSCKEAVFAIPYDSKYAGGFSLFRIAVMGQQQQQFNAINGGGWGACNMIPQFIDTYDPDDSRLKDNYLKGLQRSASGDTLRCGFGPIAGKPLILKNDIEGYDNCLETSGYQLGKYEFKIGLDANSLDNDYFMFRYADILMMKAECLLRKGNASGAAVIVTQVRQRCFKSNPAKATVTGDQLTKGSSYAYGLKDRIYNWNTNEGGADVQYGRMLDELGWEFDQEARRRQDMIRFGIYSSKSWLSHKSDGDNHTNLFPIPQKEIDKNPKIKQNPGY